VLHIKTSSSGQVMKPLKSREQYSINDFKDILYANSKWIFYILYFTALGSPYITG